MSGPTFQRAVVLADHRCWECGRWWACESWGGGNPQCPFCAGKAISAANRRAATLERSNAALRGAAKRKRGKP